MSPPSDTRVQLVLSDAEVLALMEFFVTMRPGDFAVYADPWLTFMTLAKVSLALDSACGQREQPRPFFSPFVPSSVANI